MAKAKKPPQCAGKTRSGKRCTRKPAAGSKFCAQHDDTKANRIRDWKPVWLESFRYQLTVVGACEAAGVSRSGAYEARDSDPDFREAWDDAVEASTERLEREAIRRAYEGWIEREEFVVVDGEQVLTSQVRKFDGTLLMFILKARRPDVYRENHRVEHVGADDQSPAVKFELGAQTRDVIADALRGRPAAGSQ